VRAIDAYIARRASGATPGSACDANTRPSTLSIT
jgi:hypothetical protein